MLSMYDITIPPLKRTLNNLSHVLQKGETYADAKKIEHQILLNARLYVDMYPLIRQVQIATDMSKGAGARLAGIEVPKYEDNESSFADLQERILKTIHFLETILPEHLTDSASKEVSVMVRKIELKFSGHDYLLKWVFPNVYFHVTTAYDILRHCGVELAKVDYLGRLRD